MTTSSSPAATPESAAGTTSPRELWDAWRAERAAGLAEHHGWLTLTALHLLTDVPTAYDQLPGMWWAERSRIHVRATAADGLRPADTSAGRPAADEPLDGEHSVDVTTAGSTIAAIAPDDVAVEAGVRSGQPILRVRDPRAPMATGFTGVPTFDLDPAWTLEVPVRWYDQPVPAVVGAAQPGFTHDVTVNGEVDLVHDGQTVTLRLVGTAPGRGTLSFTDTSPDTPAWRSLTVDTAGQVEGTVVLDLNYAYDMPCAFSDFGTCPQPLEGNDVPFAVTAGECRVR
jgi:uncharacterized protein (DUF1684 family)